MMRVLVAYGTKMGGTAGIAEIVGDALTDAGFQVDVRAAADAADVGAYDGRRRRGALPGPLAPPRPPLPQAQRRGPARPAGVAVQQRAAGRLRGRWRSEERRVGKEGRSR